MKPLPHLNNPLPIHISGPVTLNSFQELLKGKGLFKWGKTTVKGGT